MTRPNEELYQRILAFSIDEGTPDLSFAARLARENGWTRQFAEQVIVEYKRFVFLAMTAGHTVTPSEQVDQAWHLHLTYTRSYWDRLCGEVLNKPLHHGPTRGGSAEAAKYRQLYEQTKQSYLRLIGQEPPADIWPDTDTRFGQDLNEVRVNLSKNWVISKAKIRRWIAYAGVASIALIFGTGCVGNGFDPFQLIGAEFLIFLIPMLLAAIITGRILSKMFRGPGAQAGDEEPELPWEETAYLAGGATRLTDAAIARLVAAERIQIDGKRLIAAIDANSPSLTAIEAEVIRALPLDNDSNRKRKSLEQYVEMAFAEQRNELRQSGYLLSWNTRLVSGVFAVLPIAAVTFLFGVPRLQIGIANHRPVGFLIATLIVTAIVALITFASSLDSRSRRANYVVRRLKKNNRQTKITTLDPAYVSVAVALYGYSVLRGTELAPLNALVAWYPQPAAGSSDGGGCSSGGGCGGGGCGGGGCGG